MVVSLAVTLRGSCDALRGVEAVEVLSLANAANVKFSAAEVLGPACELADPLAPFDPQFKTGSVDEVSCSVVEFVFFAILSETHVGSEPEVIVCDVQSIGPVVKEDPMEEAPDAVIKL